VSTAWTCVPQISRRWGLSDEEVLALPSYPTNPLFSDLDRLVLDYAVGMSRTPVEVSDGLFAELREHFDDDVGGGSSSRHRPGPDGNVIGPIQSP
jgi:hypothetical protein